MPCPCLPPAEELYTRLKELRALLERVGDMSTLVAIIKAKSVREDFVHTSIELINILECLAQEEQLLVSSSIASWPCRHRPGPADTGGRANSLLAKYFMGCGVRCMQLTGHVHRVENMRSVYWLCM